MTYTMRFYVNLCKPKCNEFEQPYKYICINIYIYNTMASTRNKNSAGDYKAEQFINTSIDSYSTYVNSSSALAYTNHLAGDGLLFGKNARSTLCNNYVDVETQLFGIGATNLVNPKMKVKEDMTYIQSLNIIDRLPVLIPEPLIVEKNQRPYPMN